MCDAEAGLTTLILSPFQGYLAGCILLQGLHPCLCSETPSGLTPVEVDKMRYYVWWQRGGGI